MAVFVQPNAAFAADGNAGPEACHSPARPCRAPDIPSGCSRKDRETAASHKVNPGVGGDASGLFIHDLHNVAQRGSGSLCDHEVQASLVCKREVEPQPAGHFR